ncbi:MAG: ABC transporter ATP-binding protein [Deltaproteobacteria bacterium RBG_16_47_11]|nr:MAG: ABC transporter ATP-binding protein [Deltaproteobacteria bacterium RBG_16_47_11]
MTKLETKDLEVSYDDVIALKDVNFRIEDREVLSLLGANGAGKTTMINTLMGLLKPSHGEVTFLGQRIDELETYQIVEMGLTLVPEGRRLFPLMTALDNLLIGAYTPRAEKKLQQNLQIVFSLLPVLAERKGQLAKTLSGGEQQMLAIGRALMADPSLLILDEPSLGLAPILVETIFKLVKDINQQGNTVLLVEQNVQQSLEISNRGYVLENGQIVLQGKSEELLQNKFIKEAYLGL